MKRIGELARASTTALQPRSPDLVRLRTSFGAFAEREIGAVLSVKNGFYAFEGALHVFPDTGVPGEYGLDRWNESKLWRRNYNGMADNIVFFAEDAFGTQFGLHREMIGTFDPETGEFSTMASSVEEWASKVLDDYSFWTGHPVAKEWQIHHGRIEAGMRLVPTIPFVMGGPFEAENVKAVDAVEGMRFRASIAVQIRDVPEGAEIELCVID